MEYIKWNHHLVHFYLKRKADDKYYILALTETHYPTKCRSHLRRGAAEGGALKYLLEYTKLDQTHFNTRKRKRKKKKETHQIMLSSCRTNGTSYSNALIQSLVH